MGTKESSLPLISLLLLFLSLHSCFSAGADTITANQSLSGDRTISSSGSNFELGFFSPGNSSNYYIGIWYKKIKQENIVWVANREAPVSDKYSAQFAISNGNLVLLNGSRDPIWSTNITSAPSISLVATLLDDGNLVLGDGSNSTPPLWQSLDNPTHVWLPGGKLAYNKRTRTSQLLTSWKNTEDPAPGLYSLELIPETREYVIKYNRTVQYWTSGPWDDNIFSGVPEMTYNYIYNFTYIDNDNESYFTYSLYNPSTVSKFVMDITGQIKQLSWLENGGPWNLFWTKPGLQCIVYDFCGDFGVCQNGNPFCDCLTGFRRNSEKDWNLNDYSSGCLRKTGLQCGNSTTPNGKKDGFLTYSQVKLPSNSQSIPARSEAECESTCLSNCSCTAYSYNSSGCSIWNGELRNVEQLSAADSAGKIMRVRLSASELPKAKNNKGIVIGAALGSVAVVIVLVGLISLVILRRRRGMVSTAKSVEGSLIAFGYRDLQHVTKNFAEKLGGGGFGSVFKGTLPDSTTIAVKKLESVSQGEKQFRMEVSTIGTIQHVNLVRLRGFCSEGNRKLLVYDYMGNGSLDSHLFGDDSKVLDWKRRYQIALGTARGLAYLHEKCRDCIIHCDIKPENILLDSDFCPKVADFGLAKLMGREFSRVLTTMRGTRGYLAPEWISGVAITAKADVYSYGMMIFEFISGRRNSEQSEDGQVNFFPSFAARIIVEGGDILGLLDRRLERVVDTEELSRICKVACWCVQDDENHRPTMGQVVQILEGVLEVNTPPIPRSFQAFTDNQEHIVFFTESSSSNQSSQPQSNSSGASSHSKTSMSSVP